VVRRRDAESLRAALFDGMHDRVVKRSASEESERMMSEPRTWSRQKKDSAPRGVRRHPSGVWVIRYTCGAGHLHKEKIGPLKSAAIQAYHDRRGRAHAEPGWCPAAARDAARERARLEQERADRRMTFREYGEDYIRWAEHEHRSFKTTRGEVRRLMAALGDRMLDTITSGDVETFLHSLREGADAVTPATVNRYRDRISGMYKRAIRLGLVETNPAKGIRKSKEPGGRIVYLMPREESAIREQLAPELRPAFTFAINTGMRWSEQASLAWRDVDALAGIITVGNSKNGTARRVPMNSVVRSLLVDLGLERRLPYDPEAQVFTGAYRTVNRALHGAVERASIALREAGRDTTRLHSFTWHGCRHTFASRLVMAGVDLSTVQALGGWKTLAMVQRYAHLLPGHLAAAGERLVIPAGAVELSRNYPDAAPVAVSSRDVVS
jgi:integrase